MEGSESMVSQKRRGWVQKVRRQEIQDIFRKKRAVLLGETQNLDRNDYEKVCVIREIISSFTYEKEIQLLRVLVEMDSSLDLFFQVTGYSSQRSPQMLVDIMRSRVCNNFPPQHDIDFRQYWKEPQWLQHNIGNIQRIRLVIEEWQSYESNKLSQINSTIASLEDFNSIVDANVITFFTFIANILNVACWAQELINPKASRQNNCTSRIQRQGESCKYILYNILAAPDQVVSPFLVEIFHSTGNHISFLSLYHNMLINREDPCLNINMLSTFVRVLTLNQQTLLDNHRQFVHSLLIALTVIRPYQQQFQNQYIQAGQRIVLLLKQLVKVINLRYDNSQFLTPVQNQQISFLKHLVKILVLLSENKYLLRQMMEAPSLNQLMLMHLRMCKSQIHLRIAINICSIISRATIDEMALEQVVNEPRYLIRVMANLQQCCKRINQKQLSSQQYQFLQCTIMILTNCLTRQQFYVEIVEREVIKYIQSLNFILPRNEARSQCQYFYINLLIQTQKLLGQHWQQFIQLFNILIGKKEMFLDLIDCRNQVSVINKTLSILSHLLQYTDHYGSNHHLQALLREHELVRYLKELLPSNCIKISEIAQEIIYRLKQRNQQQPAFECL